MLLGKPDRFMSCINLHFKFYTFVWLIEYYLRIISHKLYVIVVCHNHTFFRIPPSPFSQRELHLSHQASLSSGTRGCNRPTRCSGPLRSKVGGPSKVYARLCGMGPLGDNSHQKLARLGGMGPLGDNSHQKLARLGGMGPHGDSRGVIPIIWHPPARCIPKPSRVL